MSKKLFTTLVVAVVLFCSPTIKAATACKDRTATKSADCFDLTEFMTSGSSSKGASATACLYDKSEKKCKEVDVMSESLDTFDTVLLLDNGAGQKTSLCTLLTMLGTNNVTNKNGQGCITPEKCSDISYMIESYYITSPLCEIKNGELVEGTTTCRGTASGYKAVDDVDYSVCTNKKSDYFGGYCATNDEICCMNDYSTEKTTDAEKCADYSRLIVGRISSDEDEKKKSLDLMCLDYTSTTDGQDCRANDANDGCELKASQSDTCSAKTPSALKDCLGYDKIYGDDTICLYQNGKCKEISLIRLNDPPILDPAICEKTTGTEEVEITDDYCKSINLGKYWGCKKDPEENSCKTVRLCDNALDSDCPSLRTSDDTKNGCIKNPDATAVCKEIPLTTPCTEIKNHENLSKEFCQKFKSSGSGCTVNTDKTACVELCEGLTADKSSVCSANDLVLEKENSVCVFNKNKCSEMLKSTKCLDVKDLTELTDEICSNFTPSATGAVCVASKDKTKCTEKCGGHAASDAAVCSDLFLEKDNTVCLKKENSCVEVPLTTKCEEVNGYDGLTDALCKKFSGESQSCLLKEDQKGCEIVIDSDAKNLNGEEENENENDGNESENGSEKPEDESGSSKEILAISNLLICLMALLF